MQQMRRAFKPHGLLTRFTLSILISAGICAGVFKILDSFQLQLLYKYFETTNYEARHMRGQLKSLQEYIDEKNITKENLDDLQKWVEKQPVLLLSIFEDDKCIYSSNYQENTSSTDYTIEDEMYKNREDLYQIEIGGKQVTAMMYSDFTYRYYVMGSVLAFVLSVLLFTLMFIVINRRVIKYICQLSEDVQILEGGNLEYEVTVKGDDELTDLAKSLNGMRESFQNQLVTEQELHQANSKLVSEMSHDLRTPLTGLMIYTEILKSHRYKNEAELEEYLDKIYSKAELMKQLSDNLFEYVLDNNTTVEKSSVEFGRFLSPPLSNMIYELMSNGFQVESNTEWKPVYITSGETYIERILENLCSNIIKYGDKASPVIIETVYTDDLCGVSFVNASKAVASEVDSYGIGLESVKVMMKKMNGACTVEQTEDSFQVTILFSAEKY